VFPKQNSPAFVALREKHETRGPKWPKPIFDDQINPPAAELKTLIGIDLTAIVSWIVK
jgi:hypothetical protein